MIVAGFCTILYVPFAEILYARILRLSTDETKDVVHSINVFSFLTSFKNKPSKVYPQRFCGRCSNSEYVIVAGFWVIPYAPVAKILYGNMSPC